MTHYEFCVETITAATNFLIERKNKNFNTTYKNKNPKDIVTELDTAVGAFITDRIKEYYPESTIWNEEASDISGNEYTWTIDPIDGTANFSRHLPHFGISLGLLKKWFAYLWSS